MGPVGGRANGWVGQILGWRKGVRQLIPEKQTFVRHFRPKVADNTGQATRNAATTALDDPDEFANIIVANNIVANVLDGRMAVGLRKAGGSWVEGDRFFDREAEIEALMDPHQGLDSQVHDHRDGSRQRVGSQRTQGQAAGPGSMLEAGARRVTHCSRRWPRASSRSFWRSTNSPYW